MNVDMHKFAERFAALNASNLEQLSELYHPEICFRDPLHQVQGLPALKAYFAELYANVSELRFDFEGFDALDQSQGYLRWTLHYRHPRLASGRLISVAGCSYLRFQGNKVISHRDYFDAGALLYEHLPLFGRLIRWLKGRLV